MMLVFRIVRVTPADSKICKSAERCSGLQFFISRCFAQSAPKIIKLPASIRSGIVIYGPRAVRVPFPDIMTVEGSPPPFFVAGAGEKKNHHLILFSHCPR